MVEHNLAKVGVAGPNPVFRSIFLRVRFRLRLIENVRAFYMFIGDL